MAITPWVCHGGIVHIDAAFLAVVPELGAREGSAQIGCDPIGYPKSVGYLLDEFGCLVCMVAIGLTSIHLVNLSMATNT